MYLEEDPVTRMQRVLALPTYAETAFAEKYLRSPLEELIRRENCLIDLTKAICAPISAPLSPLLELERQQQSMARLWEQQFSNIATKAAELTTRASAEAALASSYAALLDSATIKADALAARLVKEAEFSAAIANSLAAALSVPSMTEVFPLVDEDLLEIVSRGLEETGLTDSTNDWPYAVQLFEDWLENLPPNLRNLVIQIIAQLIAACLIAMCSADYHCRCPVPDAPLIEAQPNQAHPVDQESNTNALPCP